MGGALEWAPGAAGHCRMEAVDRAGALWVWHRAGRRGQLAVYFCSGLGPTIASFEQQVLGHSLPGQEHCKGWSLGPRREVGPAGWKRLRQKACGSSGWGVEGHGRSTRNAAFWEGPLSGAHRSSLRNRSPARDGSAGMSGHQDIKYIASTFRSSGFPILGLHLERKEPPLHTAPGTKESSAAPSLRL